MSLQALYLRTNCTDLSKEDAALTLNSLQQDELMDWVNGHDIEELAKWVMKKGEHLTASLLFVNLQKSPRPSLWHQPIQEDIKNYIHKVSNMNCMPANLLLKYKLKCTTAKAAYHVFTPPVSQC